MWGVMNIIDKINFMADGVVRYNEKIEKETLVPKKPIKQRPYNIKANINKYEKDMAKYEKECEESFSLKSKLFVKFPNTLLITQHSCLAEYVCFLVREKLGFNGAFSADIEKDAILEIQDLSIITTTKSYEGLDAELKEFFFLIVSGVDILKLSENYVCHLLNFKKIKFDIEVVFSIIEAAESRPLSLGTITNNVISFLKMKDVNQNIITLDDVTSYLDFCGVPEKKNSPNQSRQISTEVKREVWKRDEAKCVICSVQEKLEYDHIIPFSKGGSNTVRNIQLLCESCNRTKSAEI